MIYQKVNTHLSQSLNEIDLEKAKRDDYAKCILADPQILAAIIKTVVPQFNCLSIEEIIPCIGQPTVSLTVPEQLCAKIQSEEIEDIDEKAGKIVYDIRFPLYYKDEAIKILMNIEAQKSTSFSKLKYHIENRITYYMSRMISSQKNIEFFNSNYDDIKKIYSIWICMDADSTEDSIIKLSLTPKVIFGKSSWLPDCDLINGVIIRLRGDKQADVSENSLIAMLELLFSDTEKQEKKHLLERNYGLKMTAELEGCVNEMCNISDLIEERALEEGFARGEKQKLISQIIKKVKRGKDLSSISDDLEEDIETLRPIYDVVCAAKPDYDVNQIYDTLMAVTA